MLKNKVHRNNTTSKYHLKKHISAIKDNKIDFYFILNSDTDIN